MKKITQTRLFPKNSFQPSKKLFEKLYLTDNLNMIQIAEKLGCSSGTVHRYIKKYRIPVRKTHKSFTKREIAIIKKFYPNAPREKILKMLPDRSWGTIQNKAQNMGIHRYALGDIPRSNPQPQNLEAYQLGYIAGIINGEGEVKLNIVHRRGIHPQIRVRMATNVTIETIKIWLEKAGFNPNISFTESKRKGHRGAYELSLPRINEVLVLAKTLLHYVTEKRKQLNYLVRYCESRLKRWMKPHNKYEYELAKRIKSLNLKGSRTIFIEEFEKAG